jgi:hypothetical protein
MELTIAPGRLLSRPIDRLSVTISDASTFSDVRVSDAFPGKWWNGREAGREAAGKPPRTGATTPEG